MFRRLSVPLSSGGDMGRRSWWVDIGPTFRAIRFFGSSNPTRPVLKCIRRESFKSFVRVMEFVTLQVQVFGTSVHVYQGTVGRFI
jgi:hypothetical protein